MQANFAFSFWSMHVLTSLQLELYNLRLKTVELLKLCERQILEQNWEFPEKLPLLTSPNEEFVAHKFSGAQLFLN